MHMTGLIWGRGGGGGCHDGVPFPLFYQLYMLGLTGARDIPHSEVNMMSAKKKKKVMGTLARNAGYTI